MAIKTATTTIKTSTTLAIGRFKPTGNLSVNIATAMCALARYAAAAPKKVKTTINKIEMGSGHCEPVPKTYRVKIPQGIIKDMIKMDAPEIQMQAKYSASLKRKKLFFI